MIKELTKHNIKENKYHFLAILGILLMYSLISVGMYDPNPEGLEAFQGMIDMLPEAMVKFLGFNTLIGPLVSYLSNYLYGFIMIIFPVIYIVTVGTRLVVKHVDKGSMTYILTMPYTRNQIIITQALYYVLSFIILFIINTGIVIIFSEIMFPGLLDIGLFLMMNLVTISTHLFAMSLVFCISTYFDDSGKANGIASGLLGCFFVFSMISRLGDSVEFFKYLTPYSLLDVDYILEGSLNGLLSSIIMIIVSTIIFIYTIFNFNKKSIII